MDYITRFGDYVTKIVSVGGAVPRYTNTIDLSLGAPAEAVEATISALKTNRYPLLRGICDACYHSKDTDASVKEWNFRIFTQHSWFVDQTMEDLGKIDLRDKLPHITIPVALFMVAMIKSCHIHYQNIVHSKFLVPNWLLSRTALIHHSMKKASDSMKNCYHLSMNN